MAGHHACQWSGGRQCWPCSSACQCRWTSIDYQWRLTALQLHESCHCLPPVDCKIKLKRRLTTLSSLALHCRNWPWPICFNMQNMPENMQENMQNMTNNMQNMTKNAGYNKKYAKQYAKYDKKYVQICSICNLVYCGILVLRPWYILHILHIATCPICPR